jgi:hypothetical protein
MPMQAFLSKLGPNAFKPKGSGNGTHLGLRYNSPRILTAGGSSNG